MYKLFKFSSLTGSRISASFSAVSSHPASSSPVSRITHTSTSSTRSKVITQSLKRNRYEFCQKYTKTYLPQAQFIIPGHAPLVQDSLFLFLPTHSLPPFLAVIATVLILSLDPLPQDLLHSENLPQLDQAQFTEMINLVLSDHKRRLLETIYQNL